MTETKINRKLKYICDHEIADKQFCKLFTEQWLTDPEKPKCMYCGSTEVRLIRVGYKVLKLAPDGESYQNGTLGDNFRVGRSRNKWKRFKARVRRAGFHLDDPYTPEREKKLKEALA